MDSMWGWGWKIRVWEGWYDEQVRKMRLRGNSERRAGQRVEDRRLGGLAGCRVGRELFLWTMGRRMVSAPIGPLQGVRYSKIRIFLIFILSWFSKNKWSNKIFEKCTYDVVPHGGTTLGCRQRPAALTGGSRFLPPWGTALGCRQRSAALAGGARFLPSWVRRQDS
jgi:hypothetical protein